MDKMSKSQRSFTMSRIRGKNTTIELIFRKTVWGLGYRNYRIKNNIKGKPDLYFPKLKIAIFIDGCFWHKCPKCYKEPKSNKKYWINKIENNSARDKETTKQLQKTGIKVLRIWEHDIKNNPKKVYKKFEEAYKKRAGDN